MATGILTQTISSVNLVLADGVHFDEIIKEYVVVVGGEIVNYAFHWSTATAQYKEASRVRRDHRESCPEDFIPFDGSAPASNDWDDDYGLLPPM